MLVALYSDDLNDQGSLDELVAEGVVRFSDEDHCCVAVIDWSAIHHASDEQRGGVNGSSPSAAKSKRAAQ
jgi:hypothetical protein